MTFARRFVANLLSEFRRQWITLVLMVVLGILMLGVASVLPWTYQPGHCYRADQVGPFRSMVSMHEITCSV